MEVNDNYIFFTRCFWKTSVLVVMIRF